MTVSTLGGSEPKLGIKLTEYLSSTDYGVSQFSYKLGTPYRNSEGLFEFVKADALLAAGDLVKVDNDGTVEALTTAISGSEPTSVGVAMSAIPLNGYGWVWRGDGKLASGPAGVNAAAATSADIVVTTHTVAGQVSTGGDTIVGLTLTAASGAGGITACFASTLLRTN